MWSSSSLIVGIPLIYLSQLSVKFIDIACCSFRLFCSVSENCQCSHGYGCTLYYNFVCFNVTDFFIFQISLNSNLLTLYCQGSRTRSRSAVRSRSILKLFHFTGFFFRFSGAFRILGQNPNLKLTGIKLGHAIAKTLPRNIINKIIHI